eukprot:gene16577-22809_t
MGTGVGGGGTGALLALVIPATSGSCSSAGKASGRLSLDGNDGPLYDRSPLVAKYQWPGSGQAPRLGSSDSTSLVGAQLRLRPPQSDFYGMLLSSRSSTFSVPRRPQAASRPVVRTAPRYDLTGVLCNMCNSAVNFMLDVDPSPGNFRLASLQSEAGMRLLERSGRSPDDISSIVLVDRNGHYIRSEAVLRIARGINNPLGFLAIFGFPVPLFIRDRVYDLVADNRYSIMGKRDVCRLSDDGFAERFIVE